MNRFYFSHIEKAAGTTLHEIFRNNDLFYYMVSPYKFSKDIDNQECYLTTDELCKIVKYMPDFKGFGGHNVRPFENYEKCFEENIYGIIFLRNPITRYTSHYYHQKYKMRIDWTFDEFLLHDGFNNFMSKKICGEENSEKAIKLIEEKDIFIGITEDFDASLLLLKKFLYSHNIFSQQFDIRYESQNINFKKRNEELDKFYNQIVNNNAEDLKLYNYFMLRHKNNTAGNEFEKALMDFQLEKINYRFNFLKMNGMKLFKKIYVKRIENNIRCRSILDLRG